MNVPKLINKLRDINKHYVEMQRNVCALLAHPETTDEQLAEARRLAVEVREGMKRTRKKLWDYLQKNRDTSCFFRNEIKNHMEKMR